MLTPESSDQCIRAQSKRRSDAVEVSQSLGRAWVRVLKAPKKDSAEVPTDAPRYSGGPLAKIGLLDFDK